MAMTHSFPVPSALPIPSLLNESFALLAHDIKNTLNVLFGDVEFLEEILRVRGSQYERDLLRHVKDGMATMCAQLTHYQAMECVVGEEDVVQRRPILLSAILRNVEQQFSLEAKRRDITLTFVLRDMLLMVDGDATALERVFANLVHNALKFTPDGGHVTVVAVSRNGVEAVVTVSDTGPGVAPEEIPLLFRKHQQTEAGKAYGGGDGLGLFIVKKLVEAHGGFVSVESGDCWTSFKVVLPNLPTKAPQAAPAA